MTNKKKFILIAFFTALGLSFWFFRPVIMYIVISLFIVLIGRPIMNLILKIKYRKFKIPRSIAALLTLTVIVTIIFGLFRVIIPLIVNEIQILSKVDVNLLTFHYQAVMSVIQNVYGFFASLTGDTTPLNEVIAHKITSILSLSGILIFLSTISSTIGMVIIAIFSIIFISFFLLKEENILLKFILFMLPKHKENEIVSAVNTIISQLRKYFFGMFIRSLIVFVLLFTGLSFTGIGSSHIALIALLSAVLNIIPYIGPILGTALGMLIGALVCITTNTQIGPVQLLLVILILSVAIQLLDTIVFQPLISSKSVDAHPLEIFIVILVSGYIAGIVGMVLGVPVYTIFRVIAKVFYFDPRKKNKQMEEKIISENSEI